MFVQGNKTEDMSHKYRRCVESRLHRAQRALRVYKNAAVGSGLHPSTSISISNYNHFSCGSSAL